MDLQEIAVLEISDQDMKDLVANAIDQNVLQAYGKNVVVDRIFYDEAERVWRLRFGINKPVKKK